jgi:hypothetical protein
LKNIPTVPVVCTGFEPIAKSESQRLGMPEMRWVLVEYPIAGLEPDELEAKAELAFGSFVDHLTKDRGNPEAAADFDAAAVVKHTISLSGDSINEIMEKLSNSFNKLCWSDGLPVVPPTQEAVDEMLAGISLPPDHVVGHLYPNQGRATVEKIAINAVMAGCRPDYMPVLATAVKGITTPDFNQEKTLISTGSFFPLVLVNGPIAKKLDINAGRGAFGPCWRANATIGRAIRLMIINIGGSWPDVNDMGVMGHPGKYTCCVAENEAASPWPSLAEELGYPKAQSTVTVFPGLFMGYLGSVGGSNPEDILQPLCEQLCSTNTTCSITPSCQTFVFLNPVHAKMLHDLGFDKQDVKQYIYQNTRFSSEKFLRMARLAVEEDSKFRKTVSSWPGSTVPMHESPDKIVVIVAGAEGTQGVFIRGFFGLSATHAVIGE